MNRRLYLLVLLAGMLACGCPSANITVSQPVNVSADDTYVHPGSKMPFPPTVGYFQRGKVTQYEPREEDVGVG
jgi:hypothetical protein